MQTAQSFEKELKARGMGEVVRVTDASKILNIQLRTLRHKICVGQIKDPMHKRGVISRSALAEWLSEDPYFAAVLNIKPVPCGAFLPGSDFYRLAITVSSGKDVLFAR